MQSFFVNDKNNGDNSDNYNDNGVDDNDKGTFFVDESYHHNMLLISYIWILLVSVFVLVLELPYIFECTLYINMQSVEMLG